MGRGNRKVVTERRVEPAEGGGSAQLRSFQPIVITILWLSCLPFGPLPTKVPPARPAFPSKGILYLCSPIVFYSTAINLFGAV